MKIWGKVLLAATLFGGGLGIGTLVTTNAESLVNPNAPGTANDPIVTKSYVDEAIRKAGGFVGTGSGVSDEPAASSKLIIVTVKPGEKLQAGEGTEYIIRQGKAVVFSSTVDGVSDLTDGQDIKPGKPLTNNHLILFPREGRGIQHQDGASSKQNIIVMVRGAYTHMDADGNLVSK